MTKKEFDRLTKESMGKNVGSELRHHYKTRRQKPSAGTTAFNPNEFYLNQKPDRFHAKINKRKPLQHGARGIQRLLGMGKANSRLRQLLYEFEHPLPGNLKYRDKRFT